MMTGIEGEQARPIRHTGGNLLKDVQPPLTEEDLATELEEELSRARLAQLCNLDIEYEPVDDF